MLRIDGIQMSLWGIAWLTCLCGSMEDAWRQNGINSSIPIFLLIDASIHKTYQQKKNFNKNWKQLKPQK
jgi:hypothetical protein